MQALYAELKEIGRGPHATVYRARDQVLGRDIAVKELANWAERPAAAVARLRFAHAQGQFQVARLLPAWVVDAERGRLATEYCPEGSLGDRILREGSLPVPVVRQALLGALEALAALHQARLLHGAVKPANLFLDARDQVLLGDGLGLRLDKGRVLYPGPLTPQEEKYLAPEWADNVGPAADLYSLGLALLELLMGNDFELLFPEVLGRAMTWSDWHRSDRTLPPVTNLVPGLPRDLARMLDRLLRKRPEDRFPSAVEALEDIRPAPHGYRRWGGPALVTAGCVAAVVLAVLLAWRPWETDGGGDAAAVQQLTKERDQARAELEKTRKNLDAARQASLEQATRAKKANQETQAQLDQARQELAQARDQGHAARQQLETVFEWLRAVPRRWRHPAQAALTFPGDSYP
jgi:hypothetical protein